MRAYRKHGYTADDVDAHAERHFLRRGWVRSYHTYQLNTLAHLRRSITNPINGPLYRNRESLIGAHAYAMRYAKSLRTRHGIRSIP